MRKYDGMFILPSTLREESLTKAMDRVCNEMEKLKGQVHSRQVLGQKTFARPMQKQEHGQYFRVIFSMDPENISPLKARYRLNEDVFRVQIVIAQDPPPVKEGASAPDAEPAMAQD